MLESQLISLGLSDKEAFAYLTLLKLGPSLASTLSRHAKVKRTSIYDILNSLIEKGIVFSFKQGKYTYFVVDDIKKIYYREMEKMRTAEMLVESLRKFSVHNDLLQVNYYRGPEAYKDLYEDILTAAPKEFVGFLHLDNFYKGLDMCREKAWTAERSKKGIRPRLIMQNTELAKSFKNEDKANNRETRLIEDEKYFFRTACLFYEGYIALFDTTNETIGIRIHNSALFEMQKQMFEICWNSLR